MSATSKVRLVPFLGERALSGEDEAFFELLARDPRRLSTEFTLGIETYSHFYRFKPSRLILEGGAFEARERMGAGAGESQTAPRVPVTALRLPR